MDAAMAWEALRDLSGTWEGTGKGEFPTLEPFMYREILEVSEAGGSMHYRQRTWRSTDDGEIASHVETGFISLGDGGAVEALNVQGTDRVEILRGDLVVAGNAVVLDLKSVGLAHDDRMISSWRTLRLEGDELSYTMGMATTSVPDGALHLTGNLIRRA